MASYANMLEDPAYTRYVRNLGLDDDPDVDRMLRGGQDVLFTHDRSGGDLVFLFARERSSPLPYFSFPAAASLDAQLVRRLETCQVSPWCVRRGGPHRDVRSSVVAPSRCVCLILRPRSLTHTHAPPPPPPPYVSL
jgi:hypothetical protein